MSKRVIKAANITPPKPLLSGKGKAKAIPVGMRKNKGKRKV
jgi:hypothetical protein